MLRETGFQGGNIGDCCRIWLGTAGVKTIATEPWIATTGLDIGIAASYELGGCTLIKLEECGDCNLDQL
ncbi:hypothetical protein DSO57_1025698 [Entomophthora muscae]|uniref:Uncharacterized protein n=1 Tax=Entomophthora muscae TaxID=34485 RepID=A0ACC2SRC0_9FUNG|nr:hypothetical protein DSO57_1025698 [Entomophthora muscae]